MINYLDNAATTFPKPPSVIKETERCISQYCGNPGRGSHRMALRAAERLFLARTLAAELFSAPSAERVVLSLNATYCLNLSILGIVPEKSHVLISDMEHNSVLRPVEYLRRNKGVTYDVFSTDGDILENIEALIKKDTRALICTHASNITNKLLPIREIGELLARREIYFIVDASQSAGSHPIDMEKCRIDALCMPSHKGLLGPQGAGLAIFSERVSPKAVISGGSGAFSRELEMPAFLPDRLEAGTMPTPAVAGLCEGLSYVMKRGERDIFDKETKIIDRIRNAFFCDRRIFTYSEGEGAIWLFNIRGVPSQTAAALLDEKGICVRPGLHCAPLAHKALRTPEDGAVRVSAGPLTEAWQADHFIRALSGILRTLPD